MQRVNYLFKDKNPNYKNGRFEWRKNNTLIIGRIHKIFDKENRLIELEFEKLTELVPFHATFDCEMTPDYIDGGHGLQVRSSNMRFSCYALNKILEMLMLTLAILTILFLN